MDVLRTRPEKEEVESVDKLLQDLYKLLPKGDDVLDALYSRRYRKQVWDIVERMMSPDYVKKSSGFVTSKDRMLRWLGKVMSSLADSEKRLREYEKENGKSWRTSVCYPLAPHSISKKMPHLKSQQLTVLEKVERLLFVGRPELDHAAATPCNDDMLKSDVSMLCPTLVERVEGGRGQIERKTDFENKYVLVFCIQGPVFFGFYGFQSLLDLCHELRKERGDDVEIVIVARMDILADTKEDFDHLLSGFPTSCLAVPYEEWEHRERIWKLLHGDAITLRCAVYDTNGLFLTSFVVDEHAIPCGAEAFPFTQASVRKVVERRKQLRGDRLENLLRPYESSVDVVVYELNGTRKKSISEVIKNKHVGLYLCCEGSLIPVLQNSYEQCKEKKEEFEIVVLYLPLFSRMDPNIVKEKIESLVQERDIRGWWCLPFNNSVRLRFADFTRKYDIGHAHIREEMEDKLIIVGPDGKILDMYGAEVVKCFGIYPFTRAAVVQKQIERVRGLRLESLLEGQHFFRGDNPSDTISGDELFSSKKKIIIYMDEPPTFGVDKGLVSKYKKLKRKEKEFEVVFIEYPREIQGSTSGVEFGGMPWYIHCSPDGTHTSLAKELAQIFPVQSLIGFGEDGHICSVKRLEICLGHTLEQDAYELFLFDSYRDI